MQIIESEGKRIICSADRSEWRGWLEENFRTEEDIWLAIPKSGEGEINYNDAVEEALCFGWIDSVTGHLEGYSITKRFTPRRKGSTYSRPNIERLIWLDTHDMIHPDIRPQVVDLTTAEYVYPKDIIRKLKKDEEVWKNFQSFTEPYKRIRVAYIDAARKRPDEFKKRLDNFIAQTKKGKIIGGYGGIEKYY